MKICIGRTRPPILLLHRPGENLNAISRFLASHGPWPPTRALARNTALAKGVLAPARARVRDNSLFSGLGNRTDLGPRPAVDLGLQGPWTSLLSLA